METRKKLSLIEAWEYVADLWDRAAADANGQYRHARISGHDGQYQGICGVVSIMYRNGIIGCITRQKMEAAIMKALENVLSREYGGYLWDFNYESSKKNVPSSAASRLRN